MDKSINIFKMDQKSFGLIKPLINFCSTFFTSFLIKPGIPQFLNALNLKVFIDAIGFMIHKL